MVKRTQRLATMYLIISDTTSFDSVYKAPATFQPADQRSKNWPDRDVITIMCVASSGRSQELATAAASVALAMASETATDETSLRFEDALTGTASPAARTRRDVERETKGIKETIMDGIGRWFEAIAILGQCTKGL
mmetsp:Transcript_66022/g.137883  ORF Transcript_66022/g.137883 Transcript_66022/m.137883 type:complete len:136 (+) Transcript_66022:177-584(+)